MLLSGMSVIQVLMQKEHVKGAVSRPINDLNADILNQVAADQLIYIL